jgi:hypothetical protein
LSKLHVNSRLIFLLCTASAVTQISVTLNPAKAFVLFNIYTPIEFTIAFFFFKVSFFSKRGKIIFNTLGAIGFSMAILFLLFSSVKGRFISEWVCFNNIIYVAWILLLVLEIYEDDSIFLHKEMPLFWFLLGMFFFTSCTILIFSFWDYIMVTQNKYITALWSVYSLFNIFMYVAFSIGLLLDVSDNLKMNKKN